MADLSLSRPIIAIDKRKKDVAVFIFDCNKVVWNMLCSKENEEKTKKSAIEYVQLHTDIKPIIEYYGLKKKKNVSRGA